MSSNNAKNLIEKKYKLDELLSKYDRKTKKKVLNDIAQALGLHPHSVNRFRRTLVTDSQAMTTDQLIIISKILDVSLEDLVNMTLCES